jgi:hypothetical protein
VITNLLAKEVGKVADKLHTARSRNDQVILDVRMYSKDAIKEIIKRIKELQVCFLHGAKKLKNVMAPAILPVPGGESFLGEDAAGFWSAGAVGGLGKRG